MYFVGIDISKYKHDCFIMSETGDVISNSFTITNNQDGFHMLLTILNNINIKKTWYWRRKNKELYKIYC